MGTATPWPEGSDPASVLAWCLMEIRRLGTLVEREQTLADQLADVLTRMDAKLAVRLHKRDWLHAEIEEVLAAWKRARAGDES